MSLKVEDVFKDMDRLIEAYKIQGRAVPCRAVPSPDAFAVDRHE